jgi:hypothetical protein
MDHLVSRYLSRAQARPYSFLLSLPFSDVPIILLVCGSVYMSVIISATLLLPDYFTFTMTRVSASC